MTPQTAEDDRGVATTTTPATARAADSVTREVDTRRPRVERGPRVLTIILSLALVLIAAAYIAEVRENSQLRSELHRLKAGNPSSPAPVAATQPTGK